MTSDIQNTTLMAESEEDQKTLYLDFLWGKLYFLTEAFPSESHHAQELTRKAC